ncbi:MAG: methylated-DNA--[protein]-cysteine S-methyltransferase [Pseudomonadota bacterium]
MNSPIGNLFIEETDSTISLLNFTLAPISEPTSPFLKQAACEISEYFRGEREAFSFKVSPAGTEFQKKVWNELQKIPLGQVKSYKEIAIKLGMPNSARAVGTAIGKNPILLGIPCHRVITGQRKLGGFSAGVDKKRSLLNLEKVYI